MEWRIHKIRLLGPRIYKEAPSQAAPVFGTGSKSMETIEKRGFSLFHLREFEQPCFYSMILLKLIDAVMNIMMSKNVIAARSDGRFEMFPVISRLLTASTT